MEKKDIRGITVNKEQDMPEWYGQVVVKGELADYSPVRGTMIIRPYGYSIWEGIMGYFNGILKKRGVQNAYFPVFIPKKFFEKEAEHAKGFAPEVAWVKGKDEEESLALRPTSETIIYDSYSRWIRSHRDLPLRINQWCNIIRWEVKDVKLFLRSREFLWQEGHCVYESREECDKETLGILDEYEKLLQEILAVPVIKGMKSRMETFAGAEYTTTIEAFMPDGKFLQCGTSHNLGQGFAKAFGISFLGKDKESHLPWQNSWGFSTRLIGAAVMQHGDDKGLILPPKIAPIEAVIVPIVFDEGKEEILKECARIRKALGSFRIHIDSREGYSPGWKYNDWELKGVPLRIEIGPKDIEKKRVVIAIRDTGEKIDVKDSAVKAKIAEILDDIQNHLFTRAHEKLKHSIVETSSWEQFLKAIEGKKIAFSPFCGSVQCEEAIKEKTSANSRCIPFGQKEELKRCIHCGKDAYSSAYFGKCY